MTDQPGRGRVVERRIGRVDRPRARAPRTTPADVGVVAALSMEVGYLIDRLEQVRRYAGPRRTIIEGECAGKVVALIVGGHGAEAARAATRALIEGHRPAWIVSAGFGGAPRPGPEAQRCRLRR